MHRQISALMFVLNADHNLCICIYIFRFCPIPFAFVTVQPAYIRSLIGKLASVYPTRVDHTVRRGEAAAN
jgi:hypothetical protein